MLKYGSGLRNSALAIANIETESKIAGITISLVKNFPSFEWKCGDTMILERG